MTFCTKLYHFYHMLRTAEGGDREIAVRRKRVKKAGSGC